MQTQVKEKPIVFSGEMVRAILDGRKTQTRRVVKPQPDRFIEGEPYWNVGGFRLRPLAKNRLKCPYEPGMRLWVREKWGHEATACDDHRCGNPDHIWYAAAEKVDTFANGFWRSSIHMPRWASRITLEVTDVRCERLHRIGHDGRHARDVLAEGSPQRAIDNERQWFHQDDAPAIAFSRVWDSINASRGYSWDNNPLVWVVSFKRLENSNV